MLPALRCQDCCYENTNERERHRTTFTLGAGAVLHVPHGICLATVFNWLRHHNEAPKSALHFGPGRYRLYWNRFQIGTGSRYPTLVTYTHTHTQSQTVRLDHMTGVTVRLLAALLLP